MKREDVRKYVIIVVAILLTIAFWCLRQDGVRIVITNNSEVSVRSFQLKYVGGSIVFDEVNHQQSVSYEVNPTSESDLRIQFEDIDGHIQKATIEAYIEPNYEGMIKISIEPGHNLVVHDCSAPIICLSSRVLWFLGIGCSQPRTFNFNT